LRKVCILGSTGSIGTQTLDIIRAHPDKFKVVGLSANTNIEKLKQQIDEFKPEAVCVVDEEKAGSLDCDVTVYKGVDGLRKVVSGDLLINSVVGASGLLPTLDAIDKGITVGLANKETLVLAGEIVMQKAREKGVDIIPIDSEHSALFQSLKSGKKHEIRNLYLTMGKGKIAEMSSDELKKVTMKDILDRPAWNMGTKISVDSATCMNKVFEVIEAKHLFGVKSEQIKVVVHPDYICHSLVEFQDGSIITELGTPDMKRYTQYALFYPERVKATVSDFVSLYDRTLRFEKPPFDKFPCLSLGHIALEHGGVMPAVVHGADHVAVRAFIEGKIGFMDIGKIIGKTIEMSENIENPNVNDIIEAEKKARKTAEGLL